MEGGNGTSATVSDIQNPSLRILTRTVGYLHLVCATIFAWKFFQVFFIWWEFLVKAGVVKDFDSYDFRIHWVLAITATLLLCFFLHYPAIKLVMATEPGKDAIAAIKLMKKWQWRILSLSLVYLLILLYWESATFKPGSKPRCPIKCRGLGKFIIRPVPDCLISLEEYIFTIATHYYRKLFWPTILAFGIVYKYYSEVQDVVMRQQIFEIVIFNASRDVKLKRKMCKFVHFE